MNKTIATISNDHIGIFTDNSFDLFQFMLQIRQKRFIGTDNFLSQLILLQQLDGQPARRELRQRRRDRDGLGQVADLGFDVRAVVDAEGWARDGAGRGGHDLRHQAHLRPLHPHQGVRPITASTPIDDHHGPTPDLDPVLGGVAGVQRHVQAGTADQAIVARTTAQDVVTLAALEPVGAAVPGESVSPRIAEDAGIVGTGQGDIDEVL